MKNYLLLTLIILLSLKGLGQSHFAPANSGGYADYMNIYVYSAKIGTVNLQAGDEIAVFDGSVCAGMVALGGELNSITPVQVGKSEASPANGFTVGNSISIKIWDSSAGIEYAAAIQFTNPDGSGTVSAVTFNIDPGSAFVRLTTPRQLTINLTAPAKEYDGTDASTGGYTVVGDPISGTVTVSVTNARFDTKNVGTGKAVTADIAISGADASNYTVNSTASTTANITGKPITITAAAKAKNYGDVDPAFTATVTTGSIISGDVSSGALSRTSGTAVGNYSITKGSFTYGGNYTETYVPADLAISAKAVTVNAVAKSKYIGAGDPVLTYTLTPALIGSDVFSGSLTRVAGESLGNFQINQGTLTLGSNYTITYNSANLLIKALPVSITVTANSRSKTFGIYDPELTYTFSPALSGGDTFSGSLSRDAGESAGSYSINVGSLTAGPEYSIIFVGATLIIDPKSINVVADAKSKSFGAVDPALTYTFSPALLNGDVFSGSLSRATGTALGNYDILQGTLALSSNYNLVYVGAVFSIGDTAGPTWVTASGALNKSIEYTNTTEITAARALFPVAADNTDTDVTNLVKVTGSFVAGSACASTGTYTNTWTVLDNSENLSSVFTQTITVTDVHNAAPTIAQAADVYVYKNTAQVEVSLSGIDPVSGCAPQQIASLVATSGNTSLIPEILVTYTTGNTTGKLVLKISADKEGESVISVTVKDNGGTVSGGIDTKLMTFKIHVVSLDNGPHLATDIVGPVINQGGSLQFGVTSLFSTTVGNVLTYTVTLADGSALPSWIHFDPLTGALSGVAPAGFSGKIQLAVTATDTHGLSTKGYLWIGVTSTGTKTLSGYVMSLNGAVDSGVQLVLMSVGANNQLTVVQTVDVSGSSTFMFLNLPAGSYIIKAVVSDILLHPELLHTYFENSSSVFQAKKIDLSTLANGSIKIDMLPRTLAVGTYRVSGHLLTRQGTAGGNTVGTGTAMPGVDVVLKQSGKIVANTFTDKDGKYAFGSLPQGTYLVEVESPGFTQDIVSTVVLSSGTPLKENVNFTLWTGGTITNAQSLSQNLEVNMFPNPSYGQVNIFTSENVFTAVNLYSMAGNEILQKNYSNGGLIQIDLSKYVSGVYLVRINQGDHSIVKKLILKN